MELETYGVGAEDPPGQPRSLDRALAGAATAPKYTAAFATACGAGLRASEVVTLKGGTGVASELREQPSVRSAATVEPRAMDRASRFTRQLPQVVLHGAEMIKIQ
jgi:hypothetical protein